MASLKIYLLPKQASSVGGGFCLFYFFCLDMELHTYFISPYEFKKQEGNTEGKDELCHNSEV